ncbi:hypothetical protein GCM10020220_009610 [Nonomuraea rubra]
MRVAGTHLADEPRPGHPVAHDDEPHESLSNPDSETLNSGILDVGSSAGLVSRLAPSQWKGMNTVGRA